MICISVDKLKEKCNPLENPPWENVKPISKEEILSCNFVEKVEEYDPLCLENRESHIKRIAFYVRNGWEDEPITVLCHPNIYPIYDGNHRFAAAIIRNDEFIMANVEGNRQEINKLAY